MCEPISLSIASIALAAASATMGYIGQRNAAKAQSAMAERNAQSALESNRAQQAYLAQRFLQQREQNTQAELMRDVQAAQATARARTAGAEAGVSGVALENVLGDLQLQRSAAKVAAEQNLGVQQMDTYHGQQNAYYSALNQRNSVPMGTPPSILAPILQVAGAGLGAYGKFMYQPGVGGGGGGDPGPFGATGWDDPQPVD